MEVGWADPGGHLSKWMGVYAQLGERGWSPVEVRGMDCYVAAGFLGNGAGDGEYRPVIRGSRGLVLKGEGDQRRGGLSPQAQAAELAEREALLDPGNPDRPVTAMRPVRPEDRG